MGEQKSLLEEEFENARDRVIENFKNTRVGISCPDQYVGTVQEVYTKENAANEALDEFIEAVKKSEGNVELGNLKELIEKKKWKLALQKAIKLAVNDGTKEIQTLANTAIEQRQNNQFDRNNSIEYIINGKDKYECKCEIENNIIILMESPHTEEFNENGAIGPANGKTGENIRKHLPSVLNQISNLEAGENRWDNYGLILMNAIQYQCSLGVDTSVFRSDVFRDFWKTGGEEDFKKRLRALVRGGDYVINACTVGNRIKNKTLKDLVQDAINEVAGDSHNKYKAKCHPSVWNNKTKIEKVS